MASVQTIELNPVLTEVDATLSPEQFIKSEYESGLDQEKGVLSRLMESRFSRPLLYASTLATALAFAGPGVSRSSERTGEKTAMATSGDLSGNSNLGISSSLERSTTDRPDDIPGRQVHYLLVVPKGAAESSQADTNGEINSVIQAVDTVQSQNLPGMKSRVDTYNGSPDISFLEISKTAAEIIELTKNSSQLLDQINSELHDSKRWKNDPKKVYVALYDGPTSGVSCSNGGRWPTIFIDGPAAQDNTVLQFFKEPGCPAPFTAQEVARNIAGITGYVPAKCVPPELYAGNGAMKNANDLMSPNNSQWPIRRYDPNRNSYFMLPEEMLARGCADLSLSNYLTNAVTVVKNGNGSITFRRKNLDGTVTEFTKLDPGNRLPNGNYTMHAEADPGWHLKEGTSEDTTIRVRESVTETVTFEPNEITPPPPRPKPKIVYKVTAESKGPGRVKIGAKVAKELVSLTNKKNRILVITPVPNKNAFFSREYGCDNAQLKKAAATVINKCYELQDNKNERVVLIFKKEKEIVK